MHRMAVIIALLAVMLLFFNSAHGAEIYVNPRFELRNEVIFKGQTYRVFEGVADRLPCMIVTDRSGMVVKPAATACGPVEAVLLYRRNTGEPELRVNRQQRSNIAQYLKWEGLSQVALFFRDSASRALVDVGMIYLTGDNSQLSRVAAKKIAKNALRASVEEAVKNPDNYLRAMAVALCKDVSNELEAVEREALAMRVKLLDYERIRDLDTRARQAYCRVVPTLNLVNNLRPDANLREQLKDVFSKMKDQMISQVPGGIDQLPEGSSENVYRKLGQTIDSAYQHFKPYQTYKEEQRRFKGEADRNYTRMMGDTNEFVRNGLQLVRNRTHFSTEPVKTDKAGRRR
jgi:hypothetical protein